MYISFAQHAVQLHSLESEVSMEEALAKCLAGTLIFGQQAEQRNEYYCVQIWLDYSAKRGTRNSASRSGCFGIGVICEGLGLLPQLLPLPDASLLLFGFNDQVVAFDVSNRKIAYQVELDRSPFASFLHLSEFSIVVVFHEIGLVALGEDGRVFWRFDKDVITNVSIDRDELFLEFMDCPSVKIDVKSGTVIT